MRLERIFWGNRIANLSSAEFARKLTKHGLRPIQGPFFMLLLCLSPIRSADVHVLEQKLIESVDGWMKREREHERENGRERERLGHDHHAY